MSQKDFYITTPIYYANDTPHLGHAYTTLIADAITRYHRLWGRQAFFLTGTDEYGQKIQQTALARGITPHEQVEECHARFKSLWDVLNIDYDHFIRTTDAGHARYVQTVLQKLFDKGEIYTQNYAGWYSVSEEQFFKEEELVDAKDPIGARPVEWIEEKNYFFRMSRYQEALLEHIDKNPQFIQPSFRRNEVLGFLKKPLQDLCISRPVKRLNWGIQLPFDKDYVTYVWFDALLNYQSALSLAEPTDITKAPLWPPDYHLIGKDILTTHSVYWTTMLLALEHPLPRHIFAHGWWLSAGAKLSKSSGNSVDVPFYIKKYGVDSLRYFLLSSMHLGSDANFSESLFIAKVNAELANELGNSLSRVHKFVLRKLKGRLPVPPKPEEAQILLGDIDLEIGLRKFAEKCIEQSYSLLVQDIQISEYLKLYIEYIRAINLYLEKRAPWNLAKELKEPESEADHSALAQVLYHAAEALRIALLLIAPVTPKKSIEGLRMLGIEITEVDLRKGAVEQLCWAKLQGGSYFATGGSLFYAHRGLKAWFFLY